MQYKSVLGAPARSVHPEPDNRPYTPIAIEDASYDSSYHDPMVVVTSGPPGSGKSYLAATIKRLGLIPTEYKSKPTINRIRHKLGLPPARVPNQDLIRTADPLKLANLEKTCLVIGAKSASGVVLNKPAEIQEEMQRISDTIKLDGPAPECCKRHYYRWHVNRVTKAAFMLLEDDKVDVVAIDIFGQFVDDVSYANYGLTGVIDPTEFGFAPRQDMNDEIRRFLNTMNLKPMLLIHHEGTKYVGGKPTGLMKPKGLFGDLGYYTTVEVRQLRDDGRPIGDGRYRMLVKDCQANASIIGSELQDEEISWSELEWRIWPDD